MFSWPFKWLMLQSNNNNNQSNAQSLLSNADIYPDSEVLIWDSESNRLLSIYRNSFNSHYRNELRGFWTKNKFIVLDKNITSRRRRNLNGTHLKSCLVVRHYLIF